MPKQKSEAISPGRAGRKPLAMHGIEARSRKVLASFTPTQFTRLEADADSEGITVAELVAMRATLYR
jgi:hypothetical protein